MIKIGFLKNHNGSIAVFYMILLSVLTAIVLAAASISLTNRLGIESSYKRTQAMSVAEGGVEKAIWELKSGNSSYAGETANSLIPGGQFDVSVQNGAISNEKIITSIGYVPSKANPKYTKTVKVKVTDKPTTENVAFSYAIQAGTGGIEVGGSSEIEGNLYSNGNIIVDGGSSAQIKNQGNAWAVGTITDTKGKIQGAKHPGASAMPLPQIDLEAWKNMARLGGTISGGYSPTGGDIGPKEVTGNMTVSGNGNFTIKGPLYIHGNLTISGNSDWILDNSFGSAGTIILVDGIITISGGADFQQNSGGGYILFISTSTANIKTDAAIRYTGSAEGEKVAFYAYNGAMLFSGSGEIVAMTGKTLFIQGSGEIEYKSGLASAIFSGGPGGTWEVKEWQEIR